MAPVRIHWHRRIDAASLLHEVREKGRRQKWHVASDDQHVLRGRLHECGVQTSECSGAGDAIDDDRHVPGCAQHGLARHDQNMRGQFTQQGQLPIDNRAAADDECAFVDTAQPPRLAAGKDRCCPGNNPLNHD
jgi:hypothetical protein